MANGLVIRELCKQYPRFTLTVEDLEVPAGNVTAILWENGAGKTTLFRCLMGHVHRQSGRVELDGRELSPETVSWRRFIGYVPEESYWYEERTVSWTLNFLRRFYESWDDAFAADLLRWSGLDPRKKVAELSRGMKRKLQLIAALAFRPRLLLLDEATTGLDMGARRETLDLLKDFVREASVAVLFSSHQPHDVKELADRIAFLRDGRIVALEEISRCLAWQLVEISGNGAVSEVVAQIPGRLACRRIRGSYSVLSRSRPEELHDFLERMGKAVEWRCSPASLEDSFLCLMRG
ncbi:MAG: hypothetical protein Kow00109_11580 [Acidobacteriota bacterium]